MDALSLSRSRAEILFAELLVEESSPSRSRVQGLCEAHPELATELERLHDQLAAMRMLLPASVTPAGAGSSMRSSLPPDLGAFRCTRLLGRGGMGEVWEAEDLTLRRTVAVKLLRDSWSASDVQVQRFQREAQAASRVNHAGIVAVHQTGDWEGRRYIVQELVPGGRTLRNEIEELHRLPEIPPDHARRVAERFEKLAAALVAAHAAGIVHRDLKPQNVLLTPAGEPKLADFGLALLIDDASLTRTVEFLGTYMYASPEQIEGRMSAVDERSDVFSLGATLYENLTLSRAFDGDSTRAIARAVTLTDPTPPHVLRGRVPRDLSLVCMKALEKRREDRYASMAELHEDLQRFLAHEPIHARAPTAPRRAWKWSLRHPTLATALSLSLASSVALFGLFVRSERARAAATYAEAETSKLNRSLLVTSEALRVKSAAAEEAAEFLVSMFEQANPSVSADHVPSLRELLDQAVRRLKNGEVEDPGVRARILGAMGMVMTSLGDDAGSKLLLEESLELWESLGLGESVHATDVALARAGVLAELGEFQASHERMAGLISRIGTDAAFDARFAARMYFMLAMIFSEEGRFDEAERECDRARELYDRGPPWPDLDRSLRLWKATFAFLQGRQEEARAALEALVDECPDLLASADPLLLNAVNGLGMILIQEGRLDEAEALYLDLCDDATRSLDPTHPTALLYRTNLARVWEAMGRYVEAEEQYRELAEENERQSGPLDISVLTNRHNVGTCLVRQGRVVEAEEILRDVWEKDREVWGDTHHATLRAQHNLAQALSLLGRIPEALALQEGVVLHTPPDDPNAQGRRTQLESLRALAGAEH